MATVKKRQPGIQENPQLDRKFVDKSLIRYFLMVLLCGLLLFLPAGSLQYWNAWLFLGVLFIPMGFVFLYLIKYDPELMKSRMQFKEKEKSQKHMQTYTWLIFLAIFTIPGFDYRFGWSDVPLVVVIISTIVMICGYFMFFMVMRQNSYASRIIEVQKGQKVIDTGLYSVVRHPMYLAALVLYFSFPLVLGSFYALIPVVIGMPLLLVYRIKNEEKKLEKELKGYKEYMKKVKYRLIPFAW